MTETLWRCRSQIRSAHFVTLLLPLAVFLLLLLSSCKKADKSKEGSQSQSAARSVPAPPERPFVGQSLEIFVGSASKPPTEDAIEAFQEKTGARVEAHFGGSGRMLSELKLTGRGDVYFPGSSDYMELSKREGLVHPETEKRVVYLIPAINVQRGNPHGVRAVEDLMKPGLRVGIARPDTVCVGLYAVEVLESMNLADKVRPNIVTHAESCEKAAQLLSLRTVDAVLGWEVFEHWDPKNIETVALPPSQVTRIGYIPAAVAKSTDNLELSQAFLEYLVSDEGRVHYKKWHYLTTEAEARKFATASTPVGGEWTLPEAWK